MLLSPSLSSSEINLEKFKIIKKIPPAQNHPFYVPRILPKSVLRPHRHY